MHSFPELVLLLYRAAQTNHKMFFSFKTGFHLHYIVIIFKTLGQCISYCCSVFLWLSEKRPCMQSTHSGNSEKTKRCSLVFVNHWIPLYTNLLISASWQCKIDCRKLILW